MPPLSNNQVTPSDSSVGSENREPAVVVVTPYSSGCCMALEMQKRGYKLLCVWSVGFSPVMKTHVPGSCRGILKYDAELEAVPTLTGTADLVKQVAEKNNWNLVACVCGGEAGVDLTDALSEYLGLMSNGTDIPNRRDKKVQQELIQDAGLRSIRQVSGRSLDDVRAFLEKESYPMVIKPIDSAGSDGVELCHSKEQAEEYVQTLLGKDLVNGGQCKEILCQEFLKGTEYVVDAVSRDGVHKVVMVWKYDKRPVNGAPFVYFGDIPVDSETEEAKLLIPYAKAVLNAIGVHHGPSHGEIILCDDGPCLVEMNCRTHGGDGIWMPLCRTLTGGYCQIDAAVDCYLDPKGFELLPEKPPSPFHVYGQCVDLVSYISGTVTDISGYEIMKHLESFVQLETHIHPGSKVSKTIDMATDLGTVVLMHRNPKVLRRDISRIRRMEEQTKVIQCI